MRLAHEALGKPDHAHAAARILQRTDARAVGEHWLFGASDEFAYSSHSGYPRTAAARAMRPEAIWTCFHYEGPLYAEKKGGTRPKRECSGPWTVAELGDRHAAGL